MVGMEEPVSSRPNFGFETGLEELVFGERCFVGAPFVGIDLAVHFAAAATSLFVVVRYPERTLE